MDEKGTEVNKKHCIDVERIHGNVCRCPIRVKVTVVHWGNILVLVCAMLTKKAEF